MTHLKFQNFEKAYNENVMPQDIVNAILALNNKSIPLFVRDIKVEDTSDELNSVDKDTGKNTGNNTSLKDKVSAKAKDIKSKIDTKAENIKAKFKKEIN